MSTEIVAMRCGAPADVARAIEQACIRFGITSTRQKSSFIGEMYVESAGYKKVIEDHRYRPETLLRLFKGRNGIQTLEQCQKIVAGGRDVIFEAIYGLPWGGPKLGNTQKGDGARFPGRGFKMLTGRDNVTRYSKAKYGDDRVVRDPTMLERLPDSIDAGAWYWVTNNLGQYADRGEYLKVSKGVNLGNPNSTAQPLQAAERLAATNRALAEFAKLKE